MWQTLLQHEFQDDDVQNFQGVPGDLTSTGTTRRPFGSRSAPLFFRPGQGLRFVPDEPPTTVLVSPQCLPCITPVVQRDSPW